MTASRWHAPSAAPNTSAAAPGGLGGYLRVEARLRPVRTRFGLATGVKMARCGRPGTSAHADERSVPNDPGQPSRSSGTVAVRSMGVALWLQTTRSRVATSTWCSLVSRTVRLPSAWLVPLGRNFRKVARKGRASALVVSANPDRSLKLTQSRAETGSDVTAAVIALPVVWTAGLVGMFSMAQGRETNRQRRACPRVTRRRR